MKDFNEMQIAELFASVGINVRAVNVADLIEYENNPRKNKKAVEAVAESIKAFGFKNPIIIDKDGVIIAGHTRKAAAEKLGLDVVPCIVADDLTPEQAAAFRLADNKTAELAEWDDDKLAEEIEALKNFEIDLSDFGFDLSEFEEAPPYGVNVEGGKNNNTIAGDLTQTAIPFSFEICTEVATKENARFYFCGGEANISLYFKLFERYLRQMPKLLVWVKENQVLSHNNYHKQYELIFFGYKKGGGNLWFSSREMKDASDVWNVSRDPSKYYVHPTQKPVELPARAIRNSSKAGDIVFEPFSGSGSTTLACEQLDRTCYAMEIDPVYCEATIRRWEALTGETAEKVTE